ncbi:hypothetical protein ACFQVC_39210 [Streptomyces monticola]|uniref:PQQ-binding-like beta-propeller repeat protein n=1 Tax=Streptomyces monticola TaxID=2666263 RepID=A0ABW2JXH4_9ACTN
MKRSSNRARWTAAVAAGAALGLMTAGTGPQAAPSQGRLATASEVADVTLGYRANSRLDSAVSSATAVPPFKKLWSRDLGSAVSAPVAVGDRVFAVVNADQGEEGGPRMELVGLNAATGTRLWPQKFLTQ